MMGVELKTRRLICMVRFKYEIAGTLKCIQEVIRTIR